MFADSGGLADLHPAAQVAAFIAIAVIGVAVIWMFVEIIRKSS